MFVKISCNKRWNTFFSKRGSSNLTIFGVSYCRSFLTVAKNCEFESSINFTISLRSSIRILHREEEAAARLFVAKRKNDMALQMTSRERRLQASRGMTRNRIVLRTFHSRKCDLVKSDLDIEQGRFLSRAQRRQDPRLSANAVLQRNSRLA